MCIDFLDIFWKQDQSILEKEKREVFESQIG